MHQYGNPSEAWNQVRPVNQTQYYEPSQGPYPAQAGVSPGSWFAFRDPCYLKGVLLGVGVALVLANPKVQKSLVRGAMKLWTGMQYAVEEVKEQIEDIKAEMSMARDEPEQT